MAADAEVDLRAVARIVGSCLSDASPLAHSRSWLQLDAESIGQPVHECEVRNHFDSVQRLVRVAMRAQLRHTAPRDRCRGPGEPACIREECTELRRQQLMSSTEHGVSKIRIIFNQTERRPVMFDSVVASVVAVDVKARQRISLAGL